MNRPRSSQDPASSATGIAGTRRGSVCCFLLNPREVWHFFSYWGWHGVTPGCPGCCDRFQEGGALWAWWPAWRLLLLGCRPGLAGRPLWSRLVWPQAFPGDQLL